MSLQLFGAVPLFGSFSINVVFPFVIHSSSCDVCRNLFISSASLPWMEVNFLNQKPCIPSWPGVFQFDMFLSVTLIKSVCISALVFLWYCLSIQPFRYVFFVAIFLCKIVGFLFHLVVGMFYCNLHPVADRIFFHCFGMSCFVYCFTFCRYLFNLPSFTSTFWFISSSCIVSFSRVVFSFLFLIVPASFFCLIIFACFRRFFIWVSSRNSHSGFDFSFVLFEGISIVSQTNFAPA